MAHEDAAPGEAVGSELEGTDLPMHLEDRLAGALGVVLRSRQAQRGLRLPELEVGHVDVHEAVEEPQRGERVIRAGVVDDRDPQPAGHRLRDRFDHLRGDVLRSHEVDVVAAALLEVDHQRRDLAAVALPALELLGDVPVLAERAAQVAQAEEDGPGAAPAAQAVLLAEMGEGARHDREAARVAGARFVLQAVARAVPRAGVAVGQLGQRRLDPRRHPALAEDAKAGGLEVAVIEEEAAVGHDRRHRHASMVAPPRPARKGAPVVLR